MTNRIFSIAAAAGLALAAFTAVPALAQSHCDQVTAMTESGTFTAKGYTGGFLVSARWGDGEITMKDGTKHKFSFHGVKLLETGGSASDIAGTVYNLNSIADLEGAYQGASATLTLVK